MKLWLDDIRDPAAYGKVGWTWAKTAEEAIAAFRTGTVEEASLDHDLTMAQMVRGGFNEKIHDDGVKSGYDVICWLEENPEFWPKVRVQVHSANPAGRARMLQVIDRHYNES